MPGPAPRTSRTIIPLRLLKTKLGQKMHEETEAGGSPTSPTLPLCPPSLAAPTDGHSPDKVSCSARPFTPQPTPSEAQSLPLSHRALHSCLSQLQFYTYLITILCLTYYLLYLFLL